MPPTSRTPSTMTWTTWRTSRLVAWVRGVLERMRTQGAIEHEWFQSFIRHDGNRYFIWGGRPRGQGMPAFPRGRAAPAFPRIGPAAKGKDPLLDPVSSPQSWYARWTRGSSASRPATAPGWPGNCWSGWPAPMSCIRSPPRAAARYSPFRRARSSSARPGRTSWPPGDNLLTCNVCRTEQPGTATVVAQLDGAPCLLVRCPGTLHREPRTDNYYRRLYASTDMRRIVAREHTEPGSPTQTRLRYESEFKQSVSDPNAPNVLVATPTLEMGIDIGDLSAVLLASLPRTVASYLQRVGRAGRLTGSALDLAFVTGRGEQLPRLEDPLSVINGQVRPPATYLSAEEILRRQYVAHLVDCFAREENRPHPRRARGALGSADAGTFLGELIRLRRGRRRRSPGPVPRAASTAWPGPLRRTCAAGRPRLTASRTPAASPRTCTTRRSAGRPPSRGSRTGGPPSRRRCPSSIARDASPAASDDDHRALRSARAALAVTRYESQRLTGEYWIAVLEEFGILPNYTLLDDMVTLDVSVTWIDPETQEYHTEPASFARSSANALREFAPGATFYARGLEILIDAVDLGPDDSSIRTMAFCPTCGFAADLSAPGPGGGVPSTCPRCGGAGLSGIEHRLDVVELSRVSAQVRRDEAAISDRSDERTRERYTIAVCRRHRPGQRGQAVVRQRLRLRHQVPAADWSSAG